MLMITIRRAFRILRVQKTRTINISLLAALIGALGFAILVGSLYPHDRVALAAPHAVGNEPWLEINCLETVVEEGDDFRLVVNKKFDSEWPHETMRVFWYTDPITADETDYQRLYAERQSSNGYQSKHGRMGRDFHTLEDNYPETDETFRVRFNNSVGYGHDGECVITITDDDGVGIYDLEITSTPQPLPASDSQQPQVGYAAGDVIEITAYFTGGVTTVNPQTGVQANYAGIYLQVGENRRFAPVLRNYGADVLVFGYTVQADDLDANGISVEGGGPGDGLGYNPNKRYGGIWITDTGSSRINRIFHGLDDDPAHPVFQVKIDEPVITPPEEPIVDPPAITNPEPPTALEMANSISAGDGFFSIEHGELTDDDDGRDWFAFTAAAGESFIIEVESRMEILPDGGTRYVDNHLIDPSILEIVNEAGDQVLGEQDQGGFISNWARGYFTPEEDGTYYIAVGSGAQYRIGTGHYTISVRQDDHADDSRTRPDVVMHPGDTITARINSDVAPGDSTNPNAWVWAETGSGDYVPWWGLESADDKDVFRFEITDAGAYRLEMLDGPTGVGLWALWYADGGGDYLSYEAPVDAFVGNFSPGTHYFGVGTPYQSVGNTGDYTVSLTAVDDEALAVRP